MVKIEWTPAGTKREIRAKNIFGIESSKFTRRYGQIGEDNSMGDHLAMMPNFESCIYAALDLIRGNYLGIGGVFIIETFGNRWSGDKKFIYGTAVRQVMNSLFPRPASKYFPFLPTTFSKSGDRLLRALAIMENGDPCRNIPEGYFGQFIHEKP